MYDDDNPKNTFTSFHNIDARQDSLKLLDTAYRIKSCMDDARFCKMQPGTYTLLCLRNSNDLTPQNATLTIDRVREPAVNDYAFNAINIGCLLS